MTKQEFDAIVTENGIDTAIKAFANDYPTRIFTKDKIKELVTVAVQHDIYSEASTMILGLDTDYDWYRLEYENNVPVLLYPIRNTDDIMDLFKAEKTEEITLEDVKKFIANNPVTVDELFTDEEICEYAKQNFVVDEIVNEDEIIDWVQDNKSIGEVYDEDDITQWVKDNCNIREMISLDWY